MKQLTLIICCAAFCLLAGCTHSNAQKLDDFKKLSIPQKAQLITDTLKSALVLTDDQYTKVYPIILSSTKQASAIMQSSGGRMAKGKRFKALLAETETKVKPILTADQFDLYQAKKQNAIAYYRQHLQESKAAAAENE